MRFQREKGVALITALLVLVLISAIAVGLSWMVMTDLRLGGNNQTRESAYYGAEAGMEKLTADVGTSFITNGSLSSTSITNIMKAPPTIPLIQFLDSGGNSTYQILCGTAVCSSSNPPSSNYSNILPPSPYSGMSALITTLGLQVAAQTETEGNAAGEVKLERQVQLVAIPVFQFGVFSDSDLSLFNGPQLDFQGRIHTNGNLWLNSNPGPGNLWDQVTVSGQVIRSNMENGWPGPLGTTPGATGSSVTITTDGSTYGGYVNIALTPAPSSGPPTDPYTGNTKWRYLSVTEGSLTGYSVYGNLSPTLNDPDWTGTVEPAYNGMLVNGAPTLKLATTTVGGNSDPIFIIRRPVVGEQTSNPSEFNQQYFSEVSLRILLDDYATPGVPSSGCHTSDMMGLNGIDTGSDPIDLATLDGAAPSWWAANSTQTFLPLPTAALVTPAKTAYTVYNTSSSGNGDGYWVTNGSPTITGCIKIEYQDINGAFHDITKKILGLGFTGRNINPSSSYSHSTPLTLPYLPSTPAQAGAQGPYFGNTNVTSATPCQTDPSPNAIIRLERLRDNPATGASGNSYCGSSTDTNGYDYWPMSLFDSREGLFRAYSVGALPATPAKEGNPQISAKGVMYYVELDAANLAAWFSANQASMSPKILNATGFSVYFSDRRGEQPDTQAAVTSNPARTGSFGFNDLTNPTDAAQGCPNFTLDSGEDMEGDGILRTYGAAPTTIPYILTGVIPATSSTNLPSAGTDTMAVMQNPNCNSNSHYQTLWPGATYVHMQEARENPGLFFRRALKIVDGASLNAGTTCYGISPNPPCGLTIASENPVYVQGDFNASYTESAAPWSTPAGIATSIAADAVTFLTDNWNDINSFISPYSASYRSGVTTAYRVAIIDGKEIPFPWTTGESPDFGTDGGIHNFMRFYEAGTRTCYYEGSLVNFYTNRQGNGLFADGDPTEYSAPTRTWAFDTNFTKGVTWLPPLTPVLRTINTTGFTQMLLPSQ